MERFKRILIIVMFICLMVFLITFPGCRTIERVEYVHHYDTVRIVDRQIDSVYLKDSTYVFSKNDTVYSTKYIDRFHYKYIHDTLYRSTTDTLMQEKEVEKVVEVEKHTPVKNAFAWIGFLASVVLLGLILYHFKK